MKILRYLKYLICLITFISLIALINIKYLYSISNNKFFWIKDNETILQIHKGMKDILYYDFDKLIENEKKSKYIQYPFRRIFIAGNYKNIALVIIKYDEFYHGWTYKTIENEVKNRTVIVPISSPYYKIYSYNLTDNKFYRIETKNSIYNIDVDLISEIDPKIIISGSACDECGGQDYKFPYKIIFDPDSNRWILKN